MFAALLCNNFDVAVHPCLNLASGLINLGIVPRDHHVSMMEAIHDHSITQAMLDNPNSVLARNPPEVATTTRLQVSSTAGPIVGGGTSNMAFLVGTKDGPNADAAHVVATFWLQTLHGATEPTRLQYSQTVLLNFAGLSWPHITVATLTKA